MTEGTRCTGMSTTAFFAGLVAGIGTGFSSRGIFKSIWDCSFIYSREFGMADRA